MLTDVSVALGSNLGESIKIVGNVLKELSLSPAIFELRSSSLYRTKPVSDVPQPDFINAVCRFKTALSPLDLLAYLESVERQFGKVKKPKNAPRPIDLDIVFYGDLRLISERLEIPHPRWKERLFVLRPLLDVWDEPSMRQLLDRPFFNQEILQEIPLTAGCL